MYLIQNYKTPYHGWIYVSGSISADPEGEALRGRRELLKGCDVLLLLGDWRHSTGACMEVGMAMALGLETAEYDGSNLRALDY